MFSNAVYVSSLTWDGIPAYVIAITKLANRFVKSVMQSFNLSSSDNNFSWDKNEEHNLWLLHPVDQTREELWFILLEVTIINREC